MKEKIIDLMHRRFARFMQVGFLNAAVHFSVLNTVYFTLQTTKLTASIAATIVAMTLSFFINRLYVFVSVDGRTLHQEFLRFMLVTGTGLLVIHNSVFFISTQIVGRFAADSTINDIFNLNGSTVIAAVFALVWNYFGYKWLVFDREAQR